VNARALLAAEVSPSESVTVAVMEYVVAVVNTLPRQFTVAVAVPVQPAGRPDHAYVE
jgi:hypothetical protein